VRAPRRRRRSWEDPAGRRVPGSYGSPGLTLSARAYPLGGTASFGLWAEALEGHLRTLSPEEVVSICGGFLDDLASLLRSIAAVRGSVPGGEPSRLQLLQGLTVVLSNLARQGSVVVLDDVHLADSSSWEALSYLAHNVSGGLLILAAARPTELTGHPVAMQVLFGLEQEGLLERLPLEPVDRRAVGELAAGVVGEPPSRALIDWLRAGATRSSPSASSRRSSTRRQILVRRCSGESPRRWRTRWGAG
jgi:hypothetical protein